MDRLKFKTAVANCSGAMEATISKNGRSSKSQMSRSNFLRKACSALFAAAIVSFSMGIASCSKKESHVLEKLVGVWEGSFDFIQGETGVTLTVYKEGEAYKAIFEFYNLPGQTNTEEGKYYMNVSFNEYYEEYFLEGYEWIENPGNDFFGSHDFANLVGTINGKVFSGTARFGYYAILPDTFHLSKK